MRAYSETPGDIGVTIRKEDGREKIALGDSYGFQRGDLISVPQVRI